MFLCNIKFCEFSFSIMINCLELESLTNVFNKDQLGDESIEEIPSKIKIKNNLTSSSFI